MNPHPLLQFLPLVPEEQRRAIPLKVDDETFYVSLSNIVLIVVDDHYLTYYTLDATTPKGTHLLTVKATLGQTKALLGSCFVQPNQSMLFNRSYLRSIRFNRFVQLYYPNQLPEIKVSKDYKDNFFASLLS